MIREQGNETRNIYRMTTEKCVITELKIARE